MTIQQITKKEEKQNEISRLVCEICGNTIGFLSNECSNDLCSYYHQKQEGIMKPYNLTQKL